jgi:DNA polymerase-1
MSLLSRQRLYILDMMFFIHRAFHAVPELKAPCGTPINALYGVLALLRELWRLERYQHAVAVFECPGPSFRQQLDPSYKAHRTPPARELRVQVAMVRVACECLGLSTIHVDGYEADDVMGTLALHASRFGQGATIVSNDKDLAQVLAFCSSIELLRTSQNGRPQRVTEKEVTGMYGVPPQLISSWLAIRGDASDNIRGVKGIGQKTAVKLLTEQGDVHTLLAQPERAGRFAEAFRQGRERILMDLDLATIRTDVDLGPEGYPDDGYRLRPVEGAEEFFASLGMMGQMRKLKELGKAEATIADLWEDETRRDRFSTRSREAAG